MVYIGLRLIYVTSTPGVIAFLFISVDVLLPPSLLASRYIGKPFTRLSFLRHHIFTTVSTLKISRDNKANPGDLQQKVC